MRMSYKIMYMLFIQDYYFIFEKNKYQKI
jgi:hypothetical protein